MQKIVKQIFFFLFLLKACFFFGQQSFNSFKLINRGKEVRIDTNRWLCLRLDNYKYQNDSVRIKVKGFFKKLKDDSIQLYSGDIIFKKYYALNGSSYIKKSKRFKSFERDTILKFKLSQINSIEIADKGLVKAMKITFVSYLSARLIMVPIQIAERKNPNWSNSGNITRAFDISVVSLLAIAYICCKRHHQLKYGTKKSRLWKIQT